MLHNCIKGFEKNPLLPYMELTTEHIGMRGQGQVVT